MTDQSSNKAGVHVVGPEYQQPILKASPSDIKIMLDIIEHSILPITEKSVKDDGNKVFGAAILNSDLSLSVCSTNSETECPIFHGEVKCIYDWSKLTPSSERGTVAQSSIFLSTHEPCCMCISSILWAGFNKLFFWLPYEVTTDQGIPHDINTMHELWGVNRYRPRNKYFASACLQTLIAELDSGEVKSQLQEQSDRLLKKYNEMAEQYHSEKKSNGNNSLVLD